MTARVFCGLCGFSAARFFGGAVSAYPVRAEKCQSAPKDRNLSNAKTTKCAQVMKRAEKCQSARRKRQIMPKHQKSSICKMTKAALVKILHRI